MIKKMFVKEIHYLAENRPSDRKLKVVLNNGRTICAQACCESWQQWGGTTEELRFTMPIIERHNAWLHGEERPGE